MKECIILTGGGTAGHTTVNLKLKDELNKYFDKIIYIGSKQGIERELVAKNTNYHYIPITTVKLNRSKILSNITIPFKLSKGVKEAIKIIKQYKPSVIFSKGGYVGLPVTIAGKKCGVPVICHESDLTMGLANKLAKKYAKVVCTNFKKTANIDKNKCKYTGMPLKFSNFSKKEAKIKLNIHSEKPVLLVTGGSLGAKVLNDFVFNNIQYLTSLFYVYHITGKGNINDKISINDYRQVEFSNDMQTIFSASDYALSRAGANTCIELLSNKILTIFVPLSNKSSRGDQVENAEYLSSQGMCVSLPQEKLNILSFMANINKLKQNSSQIINSINNYNITDGTTKIISIILNNKLELKNKNVK